MALACPWIGAMTVTMPMDCANGSIIRHQVCLLPVVFGVLLSISLGCRCGFSLTMDWSNDCNHANGLCEWEHYPTSGLPPTRGVWCVVVFELEYHLDVGVALACPWIGAMTVTMPMDCANGSIIRHQVCLLPVVFGVLLSISLGCRCGFSLPMDWSNDCNHANGLCEWEHYPTSGLPPTRGVWCVVVFELEYHLDVGVASACPWIGAMTVTMPMDCANGSIIRHQVCLLPVVFGVLLSISLGCRCGFSLPMDWSNDCNHANGLCEWEHYPTSGLPPTRGVWCVVVFELEYHLDVGVASACPWIGAMTVKPCQWIVRMGALSDIRFASYPWCLVCCCL